MLIFDQGKKYQLTFLISGNINRKKLAFRHLTFLILIFKRFVQALIFINIQASIKAKRILYANSY